MTFKLLEPFDIQKDDLELLGLSCQGGFMLSAGWGGVRTGAAKWCFGLVCCSGWVCCASLELPEFPMIFVGSFGTCSSFNLVNSSFALVAFWVTHLWWYPVLANVQTRSRYAFIRLLWQWQRRPIPCWSFPYRACRQVLHYANCTGLWGQIGRVGNGLCRGAKCSLHPFVLLHLSQGFFLLIHA